MVELTDLTEESVNRGQRSQTHGREPSILNAYLGES